VAASLPSLSSLLVAVRATPALAPWSIAMSDADLSEIVRTAKTTKGAVWLATRACPPDAVAGAAGKAEGQVDTALRCLARLAEGGDPRAVAALAAWRDVVIATDAELTEMVSA